MTNKQTELSERTNNPRPLTAKEYAELRTGMQGTPYPKMHGIMIYQKMTNASLSNALRFIKKFMFENGWGN